MSKRFLSAGCILVLTVLAVCLTGARLPASSGAADKQNSWGFETANLDKTCKPCDDFYQFAMGGWMKSNPIPPEYSSWGTFTQLADKNQQNLKQILDVAVSAKAAPGSNEQKIGDFYASCMDTTAIDAAGTKPLGPELARIAGARILPEGRRQIEAASRGLHQTRHKDVRVARRLRGSGPSGSGHHSEDRNNTSNCIDEKYRPARSGQDVSQDGACRSEDPDPEFFLGSLFQGRWTSGTERNQHRPAGFLQGPWRAIDGDSHRGLENLPALASGECGSIRTLRKIRRPRFRFSRQDPDRREGNPASLEALRAGHRPRARRGSWTGLCAKIFSTGSQSPRARNGT